MSTNEYYASWAARRLIEEITNDSRSEALLDRENRRRFHEHMESWIKDGLDSLPSELRPDAR